MAGDRQAETTAMIALKKRLATGELSAEDRTQVQRVARLRALRAEGKSFSECAAAMGENAETLKSFSRRDTYTTIGSALDAAVDSMDERAMERAIRRGRISMAGLVPEAVKFLGECFERWPRGTVQDRGTPKECDISGQLIDRSLAMWATQQITKGTGLMEPIHVNVPTFVNPTFINQTIYMSRGDDAEAAKAAAVDTIDITPGINP